MQMTILLLAGIALGFFILERIWPASELPTVRGWWTRVALVNLTQIGVVILAGLTWDQWLNSFSLFPLRDHFSSWTSALIAYFISTFIYYWWHRFRHESQFFWRLCHQLHHSPRRIELLTSFYKHPVEITLNSILSSAIVYTLLGCTIEAAAYYTLLIAVAEYFYHWNVRTHRWLGFLVQRPESHRLHHAFGHHTQNYADLPIWDMIFSSFHNPKGYVTKCGFNPEQENRFAEMLAFRDVKADLVQPSPTCFGCRKRWVCAAVRQAPKEANQ